MSDVLILRIEDDLCVVNVTGKAQADIARFTEQVGDMAHMPVEHAVVEMVDFDEFGAGDIADNLSDPADVPTATVQRYEP